MSLQVPTHVSTPIAHSTKAPEPTPFSAPAATAPTKLSPPVDTVTLSPAALASAASASKSEPEAAR